MIRKGLLGAALAAAAVSAIHIAAEDDPWAELDRPRKRKPRPEPKPRATLAPTPILTAADEERIRLAQLRQARKAARQAKGMARQVRRELPK